MQDGSLILFSGEGFASWVVKKGQGSKWSHVGLYFFEGSRECILESTTMANVPDVHLKKRKSGVMITDYRDRIAKYDGEMVIRPLNGDGISLSMYIDAFYANHRGKQYEQSKWQLIASALDFWPFKNRKDLSSIFCSELVAQVYMNAGILHDDKPSSEYTPKDFAGNLALTKCYMLGRAVKVK